MNNLKEDIINTHAKIEEELNFIIDVDYKLTNELFKELDDLDSKFIEIEKNDIEQIITLYSNKEEGLKYLEELERFLFIIKKKCLNLNLKKIKLLLRRKKKKEELLLIIRILKEQEKFFNENINEFSQKEQKEIKKLIEDSIEIIKNPKKDNKKKNTNIKENIKMTSMITATAIAGATQVLISKEKLEEVKKQIEENDIKLEKKQKQENIKNNIKIVAMLTGTTIVGATKTIIPTINKEQIEEESTKKTPDNDRAEIKIRKESVVNIKQNHEKIKEQEKKDNEEIISDKELIEFLKSKEEEKNTKLKDTLTVASAIGLTAATITVAPTIVEVPLAVGAIKILNEETEENIEIEEDIKEEELPKEQVEEKIREEKLKETQEIVELIENLEEEQLEPEKIQEIIEENGLDETKPNKDSISKEERKKVLKTTFENSKPKPEKEKLRVLKPKKEKKKVMKKKQKPKEKSPFEKIVKRVGKLAGFLTANAILYNMIKNPLVYTIPTPVKTKVLK